MDILGTMREAFTFPHGRGGGVTAAAEPIALANRLRTRASTLRVTELGREPSARTDVSLVDATGRVLVRDDGGEGWTPIDPILLPAETTFYVVAHLKPGDSFLQGTVFASAQPEIVDLGTWSGYPAWAPTAWRPSAGPRNYVGNLRFELVPTRRGSARAKEILELAADGLTDKAIAARLSIGPSTVEAHWRTLRERHGYASRTEAVAAYLRAGAEREREDLEAQRDRLAAESWLRQHGTGDLTQRGVTSVRSWPGWPT